MTASLEGLLLSVLLLVKAVSSSRAWKGFLEAGFGPRVRMHRRLAAWRRMPGL